jgi:CHAD domain-containing protein
MGHEDEPGEPAAADVVLAYLQAQSAAIKAGDTTLRQGLTSVHATRVGIRRMRSTMRVFAELFDASRARDLDAELTWYSGLLGAVRDREVLRKRLAAAVSELPVELVMGPVAVHIDDTLLAEQKLHYDELRRALESARYRDLLDRVAQWGQRPPYLDLPDDTRALVRRAKKAAKKADRRLAEGLASGDAAALHRARKAAKRARYSRELIAPLRPHTSKAKIAHYTRVQDVLGAHQDSMLAAEVLRRLGAGAGTMRGHNGFTYGLLYGHEERAAEQCRVEATEL